MNSIGSGQVAKVREDLLNKTRIAKTEIVNLIQGGDRDWSKLHAACNRYAELQDASDVLGGMTVIERVKPAHSPFDESKAP